MSYMQAKQKVTLYLSPELHRRLKIRAAMESEPMSELAEQALVFYLAHPEVVDEVDACSGRSHRVYDCPACAANVVLRNGDLVSLDGQPGVIDEKLPVEQVQEAKADPKGEQELVSCLG